MTEGDVSNFHQAVFVIPDSRALQFLDGLLDGEALSYTRQSLIALAHIASAISGVPFPRDFRRRRSLVFKWFEDNLATLQPIACLLEISSKPLEISPYTPRENKNRPAQPSTGSDGRMTFLEGDDSFN
jgi:hypothetical protein